MKLKGSLFLTLCFTITLSSNGQGFDAFIKRLNEGYSKSVSMHVVMDVTVYDSAENEPFYNQQVDIKRDGNNYRYKIEDTEMLLTNKYLIVLDRASQEITCSKRSLEAEKELAKYVQFDIDSLLSLYPSPKNLGMEGDAQHFMFLQKSGPVSEVHFYISAGKQQLKKMEYKYRGGQFARIEFQVFRNNIKFDPETFSEANYVTIEKKDIKPSRYFQRYHLVDMTRQRSN